MNTLQEKLTLAEEEVLGLKSQKGEALHQIDRLQQMLETQKQQMRDKDEKINDLHKRCKDMNGLMDMQDALDLRRKADISRLEA